MHQPTTKEKGNVGLTQIIAHLELMGIKTALPIADHLPFDLIAISPTAKLSRVSVKYRKAKNNGLEISTRTIYSNTKGTKYSSVNLDEIDAYAVYCPDNGQCYYIPADDLVGYAASMHLRIDAKQETTRPINWGVDYQKPDSIFPVQ